MVFGCYILTIVVYIEAYVSTKFDPAKILVWTPLILSIDAGSMVQVLFLVIEAKRLKEPRNAYSGETSTEKLATTDDSVVDSNGVAGGSAAAPDDSNETNEQSGTVADQTESQPQSHQPTIVEQAPQKRRHWYCDTATWVAFGAGIQLIAILSLQIAGLAGAVLALKNTTGPPSVSWCCPEFQPYGLAIVDPICNTYTIEQSTSRGIGCILIPGHWQQAWIKGTVVGVVVQLVAQTVDIIILTTVHGSSRFNGVKMKRPWPSMFGGVIVLIVTLIYGTIYSSSLPPGVLPRVQVAFDTGGAASYVVNLTPSGLRGTIIGWNDGLFNIWGQPYFGSGAP